MDTPDYGDRLTVDYDPRPWVVCLCGSMRFEREIRQVAADESLDGSIVLMPLVNLHQPDARWRDPARIAEVKEQLDRLHLAKIDAADEVVIVRPGGYMGESTRREMRHALHRGKPLRFRDDHATDSTQP